MTSTENSAPVTLFAVTWDTVIGSREVGYDDETGPQHEGIRLGDMVVDALVDRLARDIKRDGDGLYGAVTKAREAATAASREEAAVLVREALVGEIRPTNHYGEPKGEPTTLRDLIRADIQAYLGEPERRSSYDERKGGFRALVREEVNTALTNELRDVMRDARAQAAAVVKERASGLIASVLEAEAKR